MLINFIIYFVLLGEVKSRKSQDDDVKSTTSSTSSVKGQRKTPAQVKRENAAKKEKVLDNYYLLRWDVLLEMWYSYVTMNPLSGQIGHKSSSS